MNVTARLDKLRATLPGCSLVVFGDLFSQITLCVSSQDKHPQEQLDALCVSAGVMLDGNVAQSAAAALGMPDRHALTRAVVLGPLFQHVYLRSPVDPADVLCCVLSVTSDVERATVRATETLHLIAQPQ